MLRGIVMRGVDFLIFNCYDKTCDKSVALCRRERLSIVRGEEGSVSGRKTQAQEIEN